MVNMYCTLRSFKLIFQNMIKSETWSYTVSFWNFLVHLFVTVFLTLRHCPRWFELSHCFQSSWDAKTLLISSELLHELELLHFCSKITSNIKREGEEIAHLLKGGRQKGTCIVKARFIHLRKVDWPPKWPQINSLAQSTFSVMKKP